jgi:hypothetical protein
MERGRRRPPAVRSAVVWINGRRALIASLDGDGTLATTTLERASEAELVFLGKVVHAIGERERVMVLGPGADRFALEREYVGIHRRPDHLIDVEPVGLLAEPEVIDRLRRLAA